MDLRILRYLVAVADERHFGRAAVRLRMTQPPLTRAVRALEDELGVELLVRTSRGAEPTEAGEVLLGRARRILADADALPGVVRQAAGARTVRVGTLADTTEHLAPRILLAFRERHPHVQLQTREFDLTDPSAGLRSGQVDVALTRLPFEAAGLRVQPLVQEAVGVVMPAGDPLASEPALRVADLGGRRWVRLPAGLDPTWLDYWSPGPVDPAAPEVRTIQECVQSVLLDDRLALAPVGQRVPAGLVVVPVQDRAPSTLALVWRPPADPLVRALVDAVALASPTGRSLRDQVHPGRSSGSPSVRPEIP